MEVPKDKALELKKYLKSLERYQATLLDMLRADELDKDPIKAKRLYDELIKESQASYMQFLEDIRKTNGSQKT